MLTRQGAVAVAVAVATIVAGRLFGIFELFLVGAGGAALVIGAVAATGLTRARLDISRDLRPPRVHAGEPATVMLVATNQGRRRTPVLALRDAVGPSRTASVVLSPLAPGEHVTAVYTVPSDHRGRIGVGPLDVRVSDPFGLAAISAPAAPAVELTIWPAIERIVAPMPALARDHDVGAPADLAPSGDEFYALRAYADGDDIRRVHWRASARRDDLVVRQDQRPGRGQVTVVLDTRPEVYRGDTFERAVSAAASIVVAAAGYGLVVRLVTAAGHDSGLAGPGHGLARVDAILDHLALVEQRDVGHLAAVVSAMERSARKQGATVVVVTGEGQDAPTGAGRPWSPAAGTIPVVFTTRPGRPGARSGHGTVVVGEQASFASVWNRAMTASATLARA